MPTSLPATDTETKFGDPDTRIGQTARWTVLLRPKQPTLGALVVVCREPVKALGEVSALAFAELREVVARVEAMLAETIVYERINWLLLMMVDRDVHFHVLPRYAGTREHGGAVVADAGWPGAPALEPAVTLDATARDALLVRLRAAWQRPAGGAARPA